MRQLLLSATTAILCTIAVLDARQPADGFLRKPTAEAIRVLTWNVYHNSVMPAEGSTGDDATRPAQFARVVRALQPDVVCLQEITSGAQRSAALFDQILPLGNGRAWQAHGALDTVILSRFGLGARGEGSVEAGDSRRGHAIAVINAPAADLYMICAHFQSSNGRQDFALRQRHAELIVSTLREARAGRGAIPMRPRTPFIVLGDLNAIPEGSTFVDEIVAATATASDGAAGGGLDWDGSALTDARPHHNVAQAEVYTWRNDLEPYPPGALDRILYSDSVVASVNQFVLDTMAMSFEQLTASGLRAIDVMCDPQLGIHDHFPLVIDLVPRKNGPAPVAAGVVAKGAFPKQRQTGGGEGGGASLIRDRGSWIMHAAGSEP